MLLLANFACLVKIDFTPPPRATALENAVAYVRFTIYDVRFINNVRVAQIFFGLLTYVEGSLGASS